MLLDFLSIPTRGSACGLEARAGLLPQSLRSDMNVSLIINLRAFCSKIWVGPCVYSIQNLSPVLILKRFDVVRCRGWRRWSSPQRCSCVMVLLLALYPISLLLPWLHIPVSLPLFVVFDIWCKMHYCLVCFNLTVMVTTPILHWSLLWACVTCVVAGTLSRLDLRSVECNVFAVSDVLYFPSLGRRVAANADNSLSVVCAMKRWGINSTSTLLYWAWISAHILSAAWHGEGPSSGVTTHALWQRGDQLHVHIFS